MTDSTPLQHTYAEMMTGMSKIAKVTYLKDLRTRHLANIEDCKKHIKVCDTLLSLMDGTDD